MDQQIIRRKLAPARAATAPGGAGRGWALALARAARDSLGLTLDCAPVRVSRGSLAELLEQVPERALILLLEGPGGGGGVLMLCPETLAALIEVQALGKVTALPVPARRPTRTDAAMVAEWADRALAGLEEALQADEDLVWTDSFRQAGFLDEPRPLALVLEDVPWQILQADCDLGGMRHGRILLALPAEGRGRQPQRPLPLAGPEEGAGFAATLEAQVLAAEAQLRAELLRLTLPLGELMSLKPGQVLPLPDAALDRIDLCGVDGRLCAQGRLGQQRGMRAVRLAQCGEGRPTMAEAPGVPAPLARVG